jgi:hypothetical protein
MQWESLLNAKKNCVHKKEKIIDFIILIDSANLTTETKKSNLNKAFVVCSCIQIKFNTERAKMRMFRNTISSQFITIPPFDNMQFARL